MISGSMSFPLSLLALIAASIIALVCILPISGYVTSSLQPLCPIIGLNSCKYSILSLISLTDLFNDFANSSILSSSCGRNSWRGGSSKRTLTLMCSRSFIDMYNP